MKNALFFVFTSIIALAAGLVASAASVSWTGNGADSLASNPQNWAGSAVPLSGQDFDFPGGSNVAWDLSGTVPASVVSASDFTLRSSLAMTDDLRIAGGAFKTNGYPLVVGGDLLISGGALLAASDSVNLSGSWKFSSGSASLVGSSVTLNGAGDKSIVSGGQHFGNLTVSAKGATIAVSGALSVDGRLRIVDGRLSLGSDGAAVQGGVSLDGGTLSLGGGTLTLAGSEGRPLSINGGMLETAGSTVEYSPNGGSAVIAPAAYENLKLSGKAVFSLGGEISVNSTLTIGTGATLSLAGFALSLPGSNMVNLGTITDGVIRAPALSLQMLGSDGASVASLKSSSGTVSIRVEDRDLNRKGDQVETVSGAMTVTTLGGDTETLVMTETGPSTGIFLTKNIVLHQDEAKAQNGQIETGQNDIIFLKYADPQDASDVKIMQVPVTLSSLAASGTPQIVAGPRIGNWSSMSSGSGTTYSAHITWETDRESSSSVAVTSPQLTAPISAGSLTGTTSHDVVVTGLVKGKQYSFSVSSMTAEGKSIASGTKKFVVIADGDRLKLPSSSAVYWYLGDKRNVFPDFTAYDSWFADWNGVITISPEQLADIPLGKVVPIRAGTYLVKIQSDPKTYAVEPYGRLRWVPTEAQAIALFGSKWTQRVRDVDVSQFASYTLGNPLAAGEAPDGFIFKNGSGEWNTVIGRATHQISDAARKANGLASRFVCTVVPSAVSALASGGEISNFEPELSGVIREGAVSLNAPPAGS
jgi:hypothetical protein